MQADHRAWPATPLPGSLSQVTPTSLAEGIAGTVQAADADPRGVTMKIRTGGIALLAALAVGGMGCGSGGAVEEEPLPPSTYTLSGFVNATSGPAVSGVTITLAGASSGTTVTNAGGYYSFSSLANGSYTVTPSLAGYTFSPVSHEVVVNGANVSGQDFTATGSITYRISGTVSGAVASGVTVTLSGPPARTTVSDGSGAYSFTGVVNATYGLTPSLPGYTFFPASHTVVVNGADVSGQDFTATRIP